jgi:hypothetical protein
MAIYDSVSHASTTILFPFSGTGETVALSDGCMQVLRGCIDIMRLRRHIVTAIHDS